MSLQLTPSQVVEYSDSISLQEPLLSEAEKLIELFRYHRRESFTRKDITHCLLYKVTQDLRKLSAKAFWLEVSLRNDIEKSWGNQGNWSKGIAKLMARKSVRKEGRGIHILEPAEGGAAPPEKIQPKKPGAKTITYEWMVSEMEATQLDVRVTHLVRRKNPQMKWDECLSFVRLWLMIYGERGTCDKYILEGKPPTSSILSHWVNHKLRQHTYHEAQDALNREFRGLRTQKEIKIRRDTGQDDALMKGAELGDPDSRAVVWVATDKDKKASPVIVDNQSDREIFDSQQVSLVAEAIRVHHKRETAKHYPKVFMDTVKGSEDPLLVGSGGVKISCVRQSIRATLRRDVPVILQTALRVLELISEEPYSTLTELSTEYPEPGAKRIREALDLLLNRGLVQEARGESFALTNAGRTASEHNIL
jgi:hypothetical protein